MQVPLQQQTEAGRWRRLVDDLAGQVSRQDGSPADLNPRPDSVLLDGKDLPRPIEFPAQPKMGDFRDRLMSAELRQADGRIQKADMTTRYFYETGQYGPSAPYFMHYGLQNDGQKIDYSVRRQDPARAHSFDVRFQVDAQSGELLSYKRRDYAMSFPEALKEVLTDRSGIALVTLAGIAGGIPFGLPGAIAQAALGPLGPAVSGIVCAGSTALVLAKLKTRPW